MLCKSFSVNATTFGQILYVIVTFLCIFMTVWILIFPSSLWHEHSTIHRMMLQRWFHSLSGDCTISDDCEVGVSSVSSDLISKYQGEYLVQSLHIFPGALWAAIVPFQLNSRFRRDHRALHKFCGYVFVGAGLLLGMGVFVIVNKRLSYEYYYDDLPPLSYSSSPGLLLLTMYFMGTVLRALSFVAFTNKKNYQQHSVWIVRHVAAGIWIALQRIMLGSPFYNRPPMTRQQQRSAFGHSAMTAIVITILIGEILIGLRNYQRTDILVAKEFTKVL
jgi:hypothetical protein